MATARINVKFHYEAPLQKPVSVFHSDGSYWGSRGGDQVQRTETKSIVLDAATTPGTGIESNISRPTQAQIVAALNAAGVGSTGPLGMSLVIEGYSSAS